jgi:hypothetical protein
VESDNELDFAVIGGQNAHFMSECQVDAGESGRCGERAGASQGRFTRHDESSI